MQASTQAFMHSEQAATEPPDATSTKKKKSVGRKPGRPYRRLADEALGVRKDTLIKKLQVLVARRTLLEDRLQAYEQELAARNDNSKSVPA